MSAFSTSQRSAAGSAPNPTYQQIADFSSSGPRWGDSWLKPDVAAPGVNIFSALVGSGWNGTTLSGTSMAAPMTSGAAALVREAHPNWSPLKVKAALVGDPNVKATEVNVETFKGTVQLSGFVSSNNAMQQAVRVARGIQGVASVRNDMRIK